MSSSSLTQKTTKGVFWNFLDITGRQGIGIVITLLLARFLTPTDYGLVAMLSIFFSIASAIMESGFQQALVRKKNVTHLDYDTVFFSNVALGILSYGLLFVFAPAIAEFYGEPRLIPLTRVVGLGVIISSLRIIQVVDLTRKLDFRTQFRVSVPAGLLSGILAVILAMNGFGVWSLAAQMVASPLLLTIGLWWINTWRPSFGFSQDSFKDLFGFGSKILASRLLNVFFDNIYVIVIAKLFAANTVGCFFFANKVQAMLLHQLTVSIQNATYPALASIQDNDLRLVTAYRRIMKATAYIIFPAMVLLGVLAKPLFVSLLNERWLSAVPYLQLLCIAGLMYPFHTINQNLLQVKGRSDLFLYLEIFKKVSVVLVLCLSIRFGVIAILVGRVITSFVNYVPTAYFSNRLVIYPIRVQIRDILPTLLASFLSGCSVLGFEHFLNIPDSGILFLALRVTVGIFFYLAIAGLLKIEIQIYAIRLIKNLLGSVSSKLD